ncbi:Ldh family oxidoreductase [Nonomuraea sp. NPDC049504]|uniref:Ldh family oxidoreductase n=1 Tax=Nonomuraea sp. NPDC049504 TaxID=3154729 RepID=UPI0034291BFB
MNASVRVLAADHLRPLARDLLTAASVPHDTASAVAEPLVEADLAGHGPHGARRVKPYLDRVESASSPRRDRGDRPGSRPRGGRSGGARGQDARRAARHGMRCSA